jgi:hypothetical protein
MRTADADPIREDFHKDNVGSMDGDGTRREFPR